MASPENIQLQVTVDGGAQQTGAVTVAAGDVIVASLADPSGVKRAVYKIWEYPDGFTVPAGWTEESSGKYSVTTLNGAAAPSFTLGSVWGKYFLSVEVNGRTRDGAVADDLYDESTFLNLPSTSGLKDTGFGETNQADSQRQWSGEMKANWRTIDTALSQPTELENALTGASNTLSMAALGKRTTVSHGSATQLTVPPNSDVAYAVGTILNIAQIGAGQVEIVQGSGVTVNVSATYTRFLREQWSQAQLWKQAANTWLLTGDLDPA